MTKLQTKSIQELDQFIAQILPKIKEKQFLLFEGDLGAGKTTFIKLLAKQIGIKQNITSPSFNYMKDYPGLIHIDLYNYRGSLDEFEDYFEDNIVAIEWANLLREIPFEKYLKINAKLLDDGTHLFEVTEEE
ncbi:tRNA (adenosine(37)-N6)-threonylcarbamoyltransferase complex ATPase subunit type 1 TsaE [Mycoplasmopsis gallopavonis]|uniref:tRNA threonylcarbamoyladenosine biosynthesis protein TsaE n=1 Tax=Mycoplasmopsis gallopavonis TaxID=76629 RepID=A0A449AYJ1_9BACT|nr:tRNA (adenosine(37)-N6)-threonylcarbamoyltransferase complex ATPase subunit type 1 TsaE [Mycoplasmopsis gallopavonis]RIV16742.1 tRNA (adenosine(37)-N6)-threonylcarbamoyltransferase complex ATPase subunit type 1 TsaE [Mycoplasmopsis gallopavonis]VEU72570.1 ATP/GTP-binding protein [Mycoplasmopsis gallopavonis]